MYFRQLLSAFFKMESPVITAKSFPQYLIGSQFALRMHKLRYWACARCLHRTPVALRDHISMCAVHASYPRMHFWACAEDWRTEIDNYCRSDVQSLRRRTQPPSCHCCSLSPCMLLDSTIAKAMKCRWGRQRWYWRAASPWRRLSLLSPKCSTYSIMFVPRREYGPQHRHARHRSRTANIKKACVLFVINQCVS